MQLHEKVALITGGTLGIGAAIVQRLAREGADVAVVARHLGQPAESVQAEVEKLGRRCLLIAGDMSVGDDCTRVVQETADGLGRLDVLVHNAGGPAPGRIDQVSPDVWHQTLDLHVSGNYYLCRAALPHLRSVGGGVIITVGSTAGTLGIEGAIAYATAKGAMPQLTRCLARELANDNIRVNCVAPGVVRTRFHDTMSPERKKLNEEVRIPLHREGRTDEVADAVAFLVGNDYITGETLMIDGGLTSRIV